MFKRLAKRADVYASDRVGSKDTFYVKTVIFGTVEHSDQPISKIVGAAPSVNRSISASQRYVVGRDQSSFSIVIYAGLDNCHQASASSYMSKPKVASNTNEPEPAEQRRSSSRILRSIWIGLFLGVLPTSSPLFWLALPLPLVANARLILATLAAVAGHYAYPYLDQFVEPLGVAVLQSQFAHTALNQLAQIRVLQALQWYNSVNAAYITIFVCGALVLGTVKQAFRFGMMLGSSRTATKVERVKTVDVSATQATDIGPQRVILSDLAEIQQTVKAAVIPVKEIAPIAVQPNLTTERTLVVHDGHSLPSGRNDMQSQEVSSDNQGTNAPAMIDLNNQVWEIPCFVENEIESVLLDEILQSMPCIVSSAEKTIGSVEVSDVAGTETLSPSKNNHKKRRRVTVKETIIDIVRWKKPSVQNAKAASSNVQQPKVTTEIATPQASEPSQEVARTAVQSSQSASQLSSSTIVMAAEPLPYLMGYLSNLNRNSEKSGGR